MSLKPFVVLDLRRRCRLPRQMLPAAAPEDETTFVIESLLRVKTASAGLAIAFVATNADLLADFKAFS